MTYSAWREDSFHHDVRVSGNDLGVGDAGLKKRLETGRLAMLTLSAVADKAPGCACADASREKVLANAAELLECNWSRLNEL